MHEAPAALRELEERCAEAIELWAGALLGDSRDPEADVHVMSDDGLVRVTEALARLARRVEALQTRCAAGVAERSRGGVDGPDLARRHGYASPERLIAQSTGGRYSDAARLVAVGEATARRSSFTGASRPPRSKPQRSCSSTVHRTSESMELRGSSSTSRRISIPMA